MEDKYNLRPLQPSDGQMLQRLLTESPDTGNVTMSPRYLGDVYRNLQVLKPGLIGVVVECRGVEGLVGAGLMSPLAVMLNGEAHQAVYLSGLVVHPNFRRQGLAARLASWRVQKARELFGEDVVLFASIQHGNVGSVANARKWTTQVLGNYDVSLFSLLAKPPQPLSGISVRPADPSELPQICQHLDAFYEGYNFHEALSPHHFSKWLADSPFDDPVRQYMVAVDSAGNILAGVAVTDRPRMGEIVVTHVPTSIRLLNYALKIVPADGIIRDLTAEKLWYREGNLAVARYLWDSVRFQYRAHGTVIRVGYDSRSPVKSMLNPKPWIAKSGGTIALYAPFSVDESALVDPHL